MFNTVTINTNIYCDLNVKNNIAINLPVKPNKGGIPAIDKRLNIKVYIKKLYELNSLNWFKLLNFDKLHSKINKIINENTIK